MAKADASCRVGIDIGGTFTDVALDVDGAIVSTKILTDHAAPVRAVLNGVRTVAAMAGIYRQLLARIEAELGRVLRERVSLSAPAKVWIATRSLAVGRA